MKRILIADPDPAFRKALALLITRKLDIQLIDEAADTGTLIQKLAETKPDLLLLNWSIHGVPGPETCTLIRNTYPDIKVVLLSLNPEDAVEAGSVGAGFICKSTSPDNVLSVLERYLDKPDVRKTVRV
jgi:DNA-binding NarL/FixJ family response regulator